MCCAKPPPNECPAVTISIRRPVGQHALSIVVGNDECSVRSCARVLIVLRNESRKPPAVAKRPVTGTRRTAKCDDDIGVSKQRLFPHLIHQPLIILAAPRRTEFFVQSPRCTTLVAAKAANRVASCVELLGLTEDGSTLARPPGPSKYAMADIHA